MLNEMHFYAVFVLFMIRGISAFSPVSYQCSGDPIPSDCSSLMIGENASFDGCFMYNNSECRNFPFHTWTDVPLSTARDEAEAGFDVIVFAYFEYDGTAYNITITNPSPAINGFYMYFEHKKDNYRSCRIFDFRNLRGSFKYPFSIYYDCFFKLNGVNYKYLVTELTVRSLPQNKEMVYTINVPKILQQDIGCHDETLIMYRVDVLAKNKIPIKFQRLPRRLNISQYEVKLANLDTLAAIETKLLDTNNGDDKAMIATEFENVDRGRYSVSVEPLQKGGRCSITYVEVVIHNRLSNYSYIGWTVGAIAFVVLVSIAGFCAIKRKQESILRKSQQRNLKILFIYHPDSKDFIDLMCCFTKYLKTLIPCEILADWNLVNENCTFWIATSVASADVIVTALSKGVTTGTIDMPVPPPYGSLFWPTYNHVCNSVMMNPKSSSKIYLKVYFENYEFIDFPEELKLAELGPQYQLMKDFKKAFCYMIKRNTLWSYFFQLPESKAVNAAIEKLKKKTNSV